MLKKISDDLDEVSSQFLNLGPSPTANHLPEWMGGTRCNFFWILPIKTHYRKKLVIEKELNIDYLVKVKTENFEAE